ncbi:MAG: hypothetical protein KDE33_07585 [Bacteroidetes bacterium]|nr:hypothetical protein [Bacteroidota bacterium]MCB9225819.1 hypothetical protein [Chitinophagales bacterium]
MSKKYILIYLLLFSVSLSFSQQTTIGKVDMDEVIDNDPNTPYITEVLNKYSDSIINALYQHPDLQELIQKFEEVDSNNYQEMEALSSEIDRYRQYKDELVQQKQRELIFNQNFINTVETVATQNNLQAVAAYNKNNEFLGFIYYTQSFEEQIKAEDLARKKELLEPIKDKTTKIGSAIDYDMMRADIMEDDFTEEIINGYLEKTTDITQILISKILKK